MKKRLHDKKAGVAILISLIIISLAEMIFRVLAIGEAVGSTPNFGEDVATIAIAATVLLLNAKGKARICYICYGVLIGYFVLDQILELPGILADCVRLIGMDTVGDVAIISRILSMIAIIGIGVLLVEYMNDGTIYNKAFNGLCIFAVLMICVNLIFSLYHAISVDKVIMLDTFNCMYRLAMVFLSTFFAYDSAKAQLKKTDLTK